MANTADREVWLNFLDEVDEYLNTIESALLGIAEKGVDPQQMDAVLRSAHTIKGIGSMIECPSMTQLAHRFEDSLKIVKVRRSSIQIDPALEMRLLKGLDSIRQISSLHRQASPITEEWLNTHAYPHFDKLHDRLGDIQPSDELALLAEESEDNTAVIMFGTEVEELLGRLQAVLDRPGTPCLREELELMVEELHDLGKMLQLDAFISLCESIYQQLILASPEQIDPLARQALDIWQRAQALVMVGKMDKLPTKLEFIHEQSSNFAAADIVSDESLESIASSTFFSEDEPEIEISEF
ncbi:MAG: hybrid sensor histidine kinase/response regulator, partial [Leptolyngbya sp. SIO3F4]|nr:hybrid sensor histidine kinase/response regulator [Leptolyngbya sp. SIO3F4]